MTKEELQKHLEIVKKLRDDIRYAQSRCANANKREKSKLESKYNTERETASNYVRMHLRDFVYPEWFQELPVYIELNTIIDEIEKKIEELDNV